MLLKKPWAWSECTPNKWMIPLQGTSKKKGKQIRTKFRRHQQILQTKTREKKIDCQMYRASGLLPYLWDNQRGYNRNSKNDNYTRYHVGAGTETKSWNELPSLFGNTKAKKSGRLDLLG